ARYATSFSPLAPVNPPTTAASFISPLLSTSGLTNRKNLFTRRLTHALVREMSTPVGSSCRDPSIDTTAPALWLAPGAIKGIVLADEGATSIVRRASPWPYGPTEKISIITR